MKDGLMFLVVMIVSIIFGLCGGVAIAFSTHLLDDYSCSTARRFQVYNEMPAKTATKSIVLLCDDGE